MYKKSLCPAVGGAKTIYRERG